MARANGRRLLSNDGKAVLSLAVLALGFYAYSVISGTPVGYGDLVQYYFWKHYLMESLRTGHLALWNPYAFAGYPFAANPQVQLFYPMNLLHLIGPLKTSVILSLVTHIWLGSVLQYYYLRSMRLNYVPAFIGAVCFALGGHLVAASYWETLTRVQGLIWLPGILLATHMAVTKRSLYWTAAGMAFLSIEISAGYAQATAYIVPMILGQIALSNSLSHQLRVGRLVNDYAVSGVALGLCIGIAAAQILPMMEFLKMSIRQTTSFEFSSVGSYAPYRLIAFFVPNILGSPVYRNSVLGCDYWEGCVYIGILPLMMLLVPAADAHMKTFRRYMLLALVVFLVVAMGKHTPVWAWMYNHIPIARSFRYHSRALGIVQFILATLAAIGTAGLIEMVKAEHRRLKLVLGVFAAAAVAAGGAVLGFVMFHDRIFGLAGKMVTRMYQGKASEKMAKLPQLISLQQSSILTAFIFLVLGMAVILIFRRLPSARRNLLPVPLVALMLADLGIFAFPLLQPGSLSTQLVTPAYASKINAGLDGYRFLPLKREIHELNSGTYNHLQSVQGFDSLVLTRYMYLVARINGENKISPYPTFIKWTDSKLIDMMSIRYVVSDSPLHSPKLRQTYQTGNLRVYENTGALPPAWLVSSAEGVPNDDAALRRITDPSFDPLKRVILTGYSEPAAEPSAGFQGTCRQLKHLPDELRLQTQSNKPGYLVLSQMQYPGWVAKVDGAERPVLLADYAFSAVSVPAGKHDVELRFTSPSLRKGMLISAISLVIAIVMLSVGIVLTRRRPTAGRVTPG